MEQLTPKQHFERIKTLAGGNVIFLAQFDDLDSLVQMGFKAMKQFDHPGTIIIAEQTDKTRIDAVMKAVNRFSKIAYVEDPTHEVHLCFYPTDQFIDFRDNVESQETDNTDD